MTKPSNTATCVTPRLLSVASEWSVLYSVVRNSICWHITASERDGITDPSRLPQSYQHRCASNGHTCNDGTGSGVMTRLSNMPRTSPPAQKARPSPSMIHTGVLSAPSSAKSARIRVAISVLSALRARGRFRTMRRAASLSRSTTTGDAILA
jgi:hypothetical protein